jgi:hypothetical protein
MFHNYSSKKKYVGILKRNYCISKCEKKIRRCGGDVSLVLRMVTTAEAAKVIAVSKHVWGD